MEYGGMEYYEHQYRVSVEMETMFSEEQDSTMTEHCIYKVPPKLHQSNPDMYTPNVVSIGPFHHKNQHLQKMKRQKIKHAKRFIRNSEAKLGDFFSLVEELEPRVRSCYSENIELNSDDLTELILVDCCFTLQFLLEDFHSVKEDYSIQPLLKEEIHWDLLLIENQLPFFVFEEIYNLAFASHLINDEQISLWALVTFWITKIEKEAKGSEEYTDSVLHFTELYRHYRLQRSNQLPERGNDLLDSPFSVKELEQAGVKFKVDDEEENNCFLDLQFSEGNLTIPKLKVTDRTEMKFRNMIAFEQCHYIKDSYFTDYIAFLDFLVNKGIITNYLGDNKSVAEMINNLGKFVLLGTSNTNYLRIAKDLNDYCKHPWHNRMATLRRDYFNTPWKTVASITAIVVIILTTTQTVLSFLK